MKNVILTIAAALVIATVLVPTMASADQASAKRSLNQYSTGYHSLVAKCKTLNSTRDRKSVYINYRYALECVQDAIAARRDIREQEARIELYESITKRNRRPQRY